MVAVLNVEQARNVLKLDRGFSASDVKKQFRMLALHCHPDKIKSSGEVAEQDEAIQTAKIQFQQLVDAKEVLLKSVVPVSSSKSRKHTSNDFFAGFNFDEDFFGSSKSRVHTPPGTKRVETMQWRCTACELDFKSERARKPKACKVISADSNCFCGHPYSAHNGKYGCTVEGCACETFCYHPKNCDCVCGFSADAHNPNWPRQCDQSSACQTFFPGDWRCPSCSHGWTCHETYCHVEYVRIDKSPEKKKEKAAPEIPSIQNSTEKLLMELRNFMRVDNPSTLLPPSRDKSNKRARPKSANADTRLKREVQPQKRKTDKQNQVLEKIKRQQQEFQRKQEELKKKQEAAEALVRPKPKKKKSKPLSARPSTSNNTTSPRKNSSPRKSNVSPKKMARPKSADFRKRPTSAQRPRSADPTSRPSTPNITVTSSERKVPAHWQKQMEESNTGRINITIPGVRVCSESPTHSPENATNPVLSFTPNADTRSNPTTTSTSMQDKVHSVLHGLEENVIRCDLPASGKFTAVRADVEMVDGKLQVKKTDRNIDPLKSASGVDAQEKLNAISSKVREANTKVQEAEKGVDFVQQFEQEAAKLREKYSVVPEVQPVQEEKPPSPSKHVPYVFSLDSVETAVKQMPKTVQQEPSISSCSCMKTNTTNATNNTTKQDVKKEESKESEKSKEDERIQKVTEDKAMDEFRNAMASYSEADKKAKQKQEEPKNLVWGSAKVLAPVAGITITEPAHPFKNATLKSDRHRRENVVDTKVSHQDDYADVMAEKEKQVYQSFREKLQAERRNKAVNRHQQVHQQQESNSTTDDPFAWAPRPELDDWLKKTEDRPQTTSYTPQPRVNHTPNHTPTVNNITVKSAPKVTEVQQGNQQWWQETVRQEQALYEPKPQQDWSAPAEPNLLHSNGGQPAPADPGAPMARPPRAVASVEKPEGGMSGCSSNAVFAPQRPSMPVSNSTSPRKLIKNVNNKPRPAVIAEAIKQNTANKNIMPDRKMTSKERALKHAVEAAAAHSIPDQPSSKQSRVSTSSGSNSNFSSMFNGGPVRATDRSLIGEPPSSSNVPAFKKPLESVERCSISSQRSGGGSSARLRDQVRRSRELEANDSRFTSMNTEYVDDDKNVDWAFSGPPKRTNKNWCPNDSTEVIDLDEDLPQPKTPKKRSANSPPRRSKSVRNVWGSPQVTTREPTNTDKSSSKKSSMAKSSSRKKFQPSGGLFSDLELPSTNSSIKGNSNSTRCSARSTARGHNDSQRSTDVNGYWCDRVEYHPTSSRASSRPSSRPGSANRRRGSGQSQESSRWSAFDSVHSSRNGQSERPSSAQCIRPLSPYLPPKNTPKTSRKHHTEIQMLKEIYSVHVPSHKKQTGGGGERKKRPASANRRRQNVF